MSKNREKICKVVRGTALAAAGAGVTYLASNFGPLVEVLQAGPVYGALLAAIASASLNAVRVQLSTKQIESR